MTTTDIVNIHLCTVAIINSTEARVNIPQGGKAIYNVMKDHKLTLPLFEKFKIDDSALREAAVSALARIDNDDCSEQTKELQKAEVEAQLKTDLKAVWDALVEIEIFKIPAEAAEEIGKHLPSGSLVTLYDFLVSE